jgi:hypothetical protein
MMAAETGKLILFSKNCGIQSKGRKQFLKDWKFGLQVRRPQKVVFGEEKRRK